MAQNTPGSFHTHAARVHALSILHSTESLLTASLLRNESTAATRTHYLHILYNLPAGYPEHSHSHFSAAAGSPNTNTTRKIAKAKGRGKARAVAVERAGLGADGAVRDGAAGVAGQGQGKRGIREAGWGDVLPEKFRVAAAVNVRRDVARSAGGAGTSGEGRERTESDGKGKGRGKGKENVYIKREEEEEGAGMQGTAPKSAVTDVAPATTGKGKQRAGPGEQTMGAEDEEQDHEDGGVSLGPFAGASSPHSGRVGDLRLSPGAKGKRRRQ